MDPIEQEELIIIKKKLEKYGSEIVNSLINSLEKVIDEWCAMKNGADIPCLEMKYILETYRQ